jgi:hypothetical protein
MPLGVWSRVLKGWRSGVTMKIPSQKIITKDNVSIDIAAVAYYHISDPEKAVIVIENVYNAINQISQTTVGNVVGRFSLDQLLSDTASINLQIKNVIDGHTEPCGTQVTAVEIKDIVLPDNMQRAMSRQDCCRRRGILGRGEAWRSGRHHDETSSGASTPHLADDGGNLRREELDHHFPGAIHDVGAGKPSRCWQRIPLKIARKHMSGCLPIRQAGMPIVHQIRMAGVRATAKNSNLLFPARFPAATTA